MVTGGVGDDLLWVQLGIGTILCGTGENGDIFLSHAAL